jgi:hypothetical protein
MKEITRIDSRLSPAQLTGYKMNDKTTFETLKKFGISFDELQFEIMKNMYKVTTGQDAAPEMITTSSVLTPIQFLQWINPKVVTMLTTKRDIDELVGYTKAGDWSDEEIVQAIVELLGSARPYGDKANPTEASYNVNYEKRTIVRFETSLEVGVLEAERAAKGRINSHDTKKQAVTRILEIVRNEIGFYGYIDGDNKTYGLLNDPNLNAYVAVAQGAASSTLWQDKTMKEICADFVTAFSRLRNQTGNNFDPQNDKFSIDISAAVVDYLSTQNEFGITVREWLNKNYPKAEIKSSAWLNEANGGANVFYVVPDELDGDKVVDQFGQDKMRFIGLWNKGKSVEEFYSNATAGCMVRIPAGVVRYSGI